MYHKEDGYCAVLSCGGMERFMKKERVNVYDWLRLIATILVVIGHSRYIGMDATNGGVHYVMPEFTNPAFYSYVVSFFGLMVSYIYSFHMPLFFFLSGAVLRLKPLKAYDAFCADKIKRLIVPYFAVGFLFMLPVKYFAGFYTKEGLHLAYRMFYTGADSDHLWFLTALFWCMLLFAAIKKVFERLHINSETALLVVFAVIQMWSQNLPFDVLALKQGLGYIGWFALGYVFEKLRKEKLSDLSKVWKIVLFFVTGGLFVLNIKVGIFDDFMNVICGCLFAYYTAELCTIVFRRFETTGCYRIVMRNLFAIYLFHNPLEFVILKVFMTTTLLATAWGCYLYLFLRIVGVMIVSVMIGEVVRLVLRCVKKAK